MFSYSAICIFIMKLQLYYRIAKTNILHEKENSAIAVIFFFNQRY